MSTLIQANNEQQLTRDLRRFLKQFVESGDGLNRVFEAMKAAGSVPHSADEDFNQLVVVGGYSAGGYATANAAAKASFDQINSLLAFLNGGALEAAKQALAMHGLT